MAAGPSVTSLAVEAHPRQGSTGQSARFLRCRLRASLMHVQVRCGAGALLPGPVEQTTGVGSTAGTEREVIAEY